MSAMRSKLAAMKQVFKEQLICQLLITTPSQLTELDVERQLKNCHWDFEIELAMNITGVVEAVETPQAEQRGSEETVWACICHIAVNLRPGSPFVRLITIPTIHSPSFQRHHLCRTIVVRSLPKTQRCKITSTGRRSVTETSLIAIWFRSWARSTCRPFLVHSSTLKKLRRSATRGSSVSSRKRLSEVHPTSPAHSPSTYSQLRKISDFAKVCPPCTRQRQIAG